MRYFTSKHAYWDFCIQQVRVPGLWLEFGVWEGASISYFAKKTKSLIHGFDSFEGLPEIWDRGDYRITPMFFSQQGIAPRLDAPNIRLVKGLFADTLPGFLNNHPEQITFVHIDCDLYSSTKTVLDGITKRLCSGATVLFDEMYCYPSYREHEHRALVESSLQYDRIAVHVEGKLCIQIL